MIRIAIIIGSTRPGRKGEAVAKWVYEIAQKRSDAEFELASLRFFPAPGHPTPRCLFLAFVAGICLKWLVISTTPSMNRKRSSAPCGVPAEAADHRSNPSAARRDSTHSIRHSER